MKRPVAMPRWLTCWTSRVPPVTGLPNDFSYREEREGGFSPTYSMKLGTPDKVIAKIWIKHYKCYLLFTFFSFSLRLQKIFTANRKKEKVGIYNYENKFISWLYKYWVWFLSKSPSIIVSCSKFFSFLYIILMKIVHQFLYD